MQYGGGVPVSHPDQLGQSPLVHVLEFVDVQAAGAGFVLTSLGSISSASGP